MRWISTSRSAVYWNLEGDKNRVHGHCKLGEEVKKVECGKYLGVFINYTTPDKQISRIMEESYNLLRNVRVAFTYLNEGMVKQKITFINQA